MLGDRDYMRAGGGSGEWKHGRQMPSPVLIIIWINIAVFVLQYFFGLLWEDVRDPVSGQLKTVQMGSVSQQVLSEGKVYRLITYMFVHGSVLHILGNMFLVYFAGKRVLSVLGTRHFLGIYFLGGILGALAQMVVSDLPLIGASAGAFALLCAFATLMPEMELLMLLYFVIPIKLRAKYLALGLVGGSIIIFVVRAVLGSDSHIAHLAHIVGAAAGWYYVRVLGYGGRQSNLIDFKRVRAEREARAAEASKQGRWSRKFGKGRVVDAKVVKEDALSKEVDRVLDKIIREGFQSLTREERKILEDGSAHIGKRVNRR